MRYFIDTEFIEKPNTIELISIGIVCEDGREYYAISIEFDEDEANDWVKENVIAKLEQGITRRNINAIRSELRDFIRGDDIQFYGYYADYDWVVFCWIFGTMLELPKGFPMYCRDLKQMVDERNLDKKWKQLNCPDPEGEHNALADARWNYKLYKEIRAEE